VAGNDAPDRLCVYLGGKPPLVRREVLEIFNASHDTPLDRRLRFDA
jgi:hypothetical protein